MAPIVHQNLQLETQKLKNNLGMGTRPHRQWGGGYHWWVYGGTKL